jgi:isopentenyldiphosphate isomerase
MKDEVYDHIDANGNIVGQRTWTEVHKQGLLHQTCAAFMFKDFSRKEILIQKRSKEMSQDPGKITLSVGGHILSGQKPEDGIKEN